MKIEQKQSLDEGNLKAFITEKEKEITEAKDHALTKLQKKVNRLRKQEPATEEEKTSLLKEADELSEAIAFLRDIPPDKLMSLALLDQRVFSEDYNNSEATSEQRAVFRFASLKSIQPTIHLFHEQYPDWKDAGENLMSKIELNNNNSAPVTDEPKKKKKKKKKEAAAAASEEQNNNCVVHSELANGEVTDGPKKKKKKKVSKGKQNGNSKAHSELTNGAVVDGEPKKKKKKKNAKKCLKRKGEVTENVSNSNEGSPVPLKKLKKSEDCVSAAAVELDDSKNKAKTKSLKKKKKQKAIKKVLSKCKNEPDTVMSSLAEMSGNSEISSPSEKNEEKFNTTPYTPNPAVNGFRGGNSSRGSRKPKDDGPLPAWKIRRIVPWSSSNLISVSDDWKKKADAPKEEGGEQKESLLRPSWLTNPEEYKPSPMTFGGRGYGHRNFQRREPSSANKIRISSDWKDKISPKKDDAESTGDSSPGSSLLKPTWLTNPENNPPPPTFNFRGNSRGRGRGGRWGRGRGRN